MFLTLLYPFLVALLITIGLTPLTIKFAKKYKLVDDPKRHKHPAIIHKRVIPRAGGLPIYIAILITTIFFIPLDPRYIAILFSGFLVVLLGLFDDKYDLSPYVRFVGNIICVAIVVLSGVVIPFITSPVGGILHFSNFSYSLGPLVISFGGVLAVVWIVWIMNMLNWSKGVDGQMPGVAAVSAIIIGIASIRFSVLTDSNVLAAQISFIVAGASLGFLFYNFYPAKIFPGYSATILGFMIGVLSIISGVKLATAILVMGVPTADAMFTILRRLLARRSPFWHDKGHLHHLLLDYGMDQRSIAITYWVISILLGLFALNLSSRGKLFAIILVVVLVGAIILSLKFFRKKENV
ncbi:MAG TPA: MraY family glycosyltransferase [Patescibacteria group bacterium]|nr:MraY family glycosyltransferase [Patescibacteria group bacterium]